jgi:putative heme-binding domain-containing protein
MSAARPPVDCRWFVCILLVTSVVLGRSVVRAADDSPYALADPRLKTVVIDSSPDESFISVRADTLGRLFVGGREALFVYEPKPEGGYQPRRELYRFPKDTWVNDIAIRGHDLYVATVPALYVLPDAVTKRTGIVPRRLLWGGPLGHVHQCLHGLAWGPEGDLYVSMGDPEPGYGDFNRPDHWCHWTFYNQPLGSSEPVSTPYNGVGGVFRIRPDGSRFQVVARGLRNACGLAFDQHWNLFTNDNDHESLPAQYVPGRLLHVTPHANFSWPRGWLLSKNPERADLLETMTDGLGRAVPVGQSYYADTLLPAEYRDNLLLARWCIGAVTRFPLEHRGASFTTEQRELLQGHDQARPVGVSVGCGGRIFATVAFMAQNEGSPVYRSDLVMVTTQGDPSSAPFEAYDVTTLDDAALLKELRQADWSRRLAAHQEILRRGLHGLGGVDFRQLAEAATDDRERESCVWLAAAAGDGDTRGWLNAVAVDPRWATVRLQVVRALAEYPQLGANPALFAAAIKDPDPQVQLAAVVGLFNFRGPLPPQVVSGPARSTDTYLRQTAATLIAEKATLAELHDLCKSNDPATRLAGVLATGFRLTMPPAVGRLPSDVQLDKFRNKEDAYVIQYADKKIDLRNLEPMGQYTFADHWKQGQHTSDQEALFALLQSLLKDPATPVRLQASYFLSLVNDPRSEPEVTHVVQANEERLLSMAKISGVGKVWLVGPFDDSHEGFSREHPPETSPIDLAQNYPGRGGRVTWKQQAMGRQYDFVALYGPVDHCSAYAYFQLESATRGRAHVQIGSNDGVKVWHNGRVVWTNDVARIALPMQDVVPVELQPGTNDILVRVRNRTGDSALQLNYRALGNVVVQLPEKLDFAGLAERLASAPQGGASVPPEFLKVDWTKASAEGNVEQGRKLFEGIGCAKCHALRADAPASGGPSLADAPRRFTTAHLVESILLPSKQISPLFRATQVLTSDGRQLSGLVVGETADKIELLQADAKRVEVKKADVEQRQLLELSPMPQGLVKQPTELRDLLAYLLKG